MPPSVCVTLIAGTNRTKNVQMGQNCDQYAPLLYNFGYFIKACELFPMKIILICITQMCRNLL